MSKNDARKGIKTKEGLEMANKKFQLDEDEADLNKDGEVSSYERERGEAVQKVAMDKELDSGGYLEDSANPSIRGTNLSEIKESQKDFDVDKGLKEWIIDGKTYDDFSVSEIQMMNERIAELRANIKQADPYYKSKLDQNYADESVDIPLKEIIKTLGKETEDTPNVSPKELYGGGLMDEMGYGMMGMNAGYDEVSGNPIPVGSNAENVRDDISAALSSGEYVLPADVVKWHGLKHIQCMMDEAKMGLMSMHMEGQIHDITEEEEPDSKKSEDSGKSEDEDSSAKKGEEDTEEKIETPEGNVIEMAESVVEEIKPSGHAIAVKQKPRVKVYMP